MLFDDVLRVWPVWLVWVARIGLTVFVRFFGKGRPPNSVCSHMPPDRKIVRNLFGHVSKKSYDRPQFCCFDIRTFGDTDGTFFKRHASSAHQTEVTN